MLPTSADPPPIVLNFAAAVLIAWAISNFGLKPIPADGANPEMSFYPPLFESKRQTNYRRDRYYRLRAAQAAGVRSARF